jgi:tripartite-type tricarboxylate transporter receptor subunit TctC
MALRSAPEVVGRPYVMTPGSPDAMVKMVREAFEKAIKDPELIADAMKLNMPVKFGSGEFVTERIKQALTQTPETIALLKQAAAAQ